MAGRTQGPIPSKKPQQRKTILAPGPSTSARATTHSLACKVTGVYVCLFIAGLCLAARHVEK